MPHIQRHNEKELRSIKEERDRFYQRSGSADLDRKRRLLLQLQRAKKVKLTSMEADNTVREVKRRSSDYTPEALQERIRESCRRGSRAGLS